MASHRNRWLDLILTHHRNARDAWLALRESEACMQMEDDEFEAAHPPPTLKAAMQGLSQKPDDRISA